MSTAPALPVPGTGAERVRDTVDEVLRRPEYAEAAPSLVARLRAWVGEQLGSLLEGLLAAEQAALLGTVALVALVGLAVALAVRFLRGVRPDPAATAVVEGPTGLTSADWRDEAESHERAGRWRHALRGHYRALLAGLAEAGLVEEVPGRTTGEYRAQLSAAAPAAAASFASVTAEFEQVWYGERPVGPAEVAAYRGRVASVRREATGRVPVGARA